MPATQKVCSCPTQQQQQQAGCCAVVGLLRSFGGLQRYVHCVPGFVATSYMSAACVLCLQESMLRLLEVAPVQNACAAAHLVVDYCVQQSSLCCCKGLVGQFWVSCRRRPPGGVGGGLPNVCLGDLSWISSRQYAFWGCIGRASSPPCVSPVAAQSDACYTSQSDLQPLAGYCAMAVCSRLQATVI